MRNGREREGKVGIIKGEIKKKIEIEDENGDTAQGSSRVLAGRVKEETSLKGATSFTHVQ